MAGIPTCLDSARLSFYLTRMVFSSPLFLFFFLPLVLALYAVTPSWLRNGWLLLASFAFYAWGERSFLWVIAVSIAMNYLFGLLVETWRGKSLGRGVLAAAIVSNVALLGWFKYAGFLAVPFNRILTLFHAEPVALAPIHLPIGISFFTFHALSYVVDVHREHARAQKDPVKLALYIALFPQLIAGPILRFHDVADQIDRRPFNLSLFSDGVRRFIVGLAKKILIANPLAGPADAIFSSSPGDLSVGAAWLGVVAYSLQIYFDFAGYSDMALGLGKMFGFVFPENFDYPYISSSIKEFWRRWHISLSTWFRDYLYIPIGGNRLSGMRTYVNLIVVFFLCGLWHGASWTFVIWGLYHGLFLILERHPALQRLAVPFRPLRHAYALLVVGGGWVFFRSETLAHALQYFGVLAGRHGPRTVTTAIQFATPDMAAALFAGVIGSTPYVTRALRAAHTRAAGANSAWQYGLEAMHVAGLTALLLLCATELAAGTYNPFIYFRF